MAPSAVDPVINNSPDSRPLKRARKAGPSRPRDDEHTFEAAAPHVDHIFIAEGNSAKKPGGKKVRLCSGSSALSANVSPVRPLYRVVNVEGT